MAETESPPPRREPETGRFERKMKAPSLETLIAGAFALVLSGGVGVGVSSVNSKELGSKLDAIFAKQDALQTSLVKLEGKFAAYEASKLEERIRDLERSSAEAGVLHKATDERLRRLEEKR